MQLIPIFTLLATAMAMNQGKNSQPTRSNAMNPNNNAYNPTASQGKGGNPSADRAAAMNPQHTAYNPTSGKGSSQGGKSGKR
jgi:hypothetical protein